MSGGLKAQLRRTAAGSAVTAIERPDAAPSQEVLQPPETPHAGTTSAASMEDALAELDALIERSKSAAPGTLSGQADAHASPVVPAPAAPSAPRSAIAPAATPSTVSPIRPPIAALHTPAQAVAFINQSHFIAPLAGEMTPWRIGTDQETGRRTVTPVSPSSMRLEFQPFTVSVSTPTGVRSVPIVELRMRSPSRREYPGGVILQPEGATPPGCFNLWEGFGVTAAAGDASPMVDHSVMLCGGNENTSDYVLNWLASCVQFPGRQPEVAMVLRGGRGTGKGTVFRVMLMIFGSHGLHITQPKHLVGNFNSQLRRALFIFADEAYYAGDKAAEGVLKGLITEPSILIEMKGRDVFAAPNRVKLAMASNSSFVVPAGADERRYCVIDVSSARAQDHSYFGALNAWIDNGGAGIFLDYLLQRDLTSFNVRAVPKTAALDLQKIEGMASLDRWILEALDTGVGLSGADWTDDPQRVICDTAAARLDVYCKRSANRGTRADTRGIGRRLNEIFGCGPAVVSQRARAWALTGITQARATAASAFGLAHYQWGGA